MDWGAELWDQFENVDKHLHHGIEHTEKYMKFVQERSSIEQEYAKKLRRLVKSYMPKKKDDDSSIFSTNKAFQSQLSELNDIAGQHEIVAESYLKSIAKALHSFINELRIEKKKAYQEGKHLQSQLDAQERVLEQTKKRFEKEWKESERAQAFYDKLDADPNVTKAEVDKAKQASIVKKDSVESCKGDYASALTKFNSDQRNHFQSAMPQVFENYRDMDERRIKKTSEVMVEFSKIDSDVKPIVNKCLQGMKQAAEAVDSNLDAKLVVEKFKSGFFPPNDKEFEDYTSKQYNSSANEDHASSPRNSVNLTKGGNKKGLSWLFGGKKQNMPAGHIRHSSPDSSGGGGNNSPEKTHSEGSSESSTTTDSQNTPNREKSRSSSRKSQKDPNKVVGVTITEQQCDSTDSSPTASADKKAINPEMIRRSIFVGKKKILSMFKDNPTGTPPPRPSKPPRRVEISGPVTSKSDAAMLPSCDSYIPIQREGDKKPTAKEEKVENPYCEVYSEDEFTDGSQDGDIEHNTPNKARRCPLQSLKRDSPVLEIEKSSKHIFLFFVHSGV